MPELSQSCPATRVLVIDDYVDDLEITCALLRKLGCEVRGVSDPSDSLAAAQEFQPQLVLLDIAMPRINGFTVAKTLLDAGLPPFCLAARTGFGDAATKAKCLAAGFHDILIKPDQVESLRALVERVAASG